MPLEWAKQFLFDVISYKSKYSERPPQSKAMEILCWLMSGQTHHK